MILFPDGVPLVKRLFDLLVTILGLVLLSPLLILIAGLVWYYHGRPVIFRQERGGYRGSMFQVYKFRSMTLEKDRKGRLLPDTQRLTRFGRFIRATSLDELPEMINVLRGEMSWVGPRPLFSRYLNRYNNEQARRHDVLPGITGWAQVNGRNALNWDEKFVLDLWYVDHWTFLLDIRILLMTLIKVIKREGIAQPGFSTSEEFLPEPDAFESEISTPGDIQDRG